MAEDAVPHPLVPRHGGRHPRPHVLIHRPRPIPVQVNMLAVVVLGAKSIILYFDIVQSVTGL